TERAYASLKSDYQIDNQVISTEVGGDFGSLRDELRANVPPELRVEGEKKRSVKVGEAMTLVVFAGDPDNLPARRDGKPQPRDAGGHWNPENPENPTNRANRVNPANPENPSNRANPANPVNPANPANPVNPVNLVYRPPSAIVPAS